MPRVPTYRFCSFSLLLACGTAARQQDVPDGQVDARASDANIDAGTGENDGSSDAAAAQADAGGEELLIDHAHWRQFDAAADPLPSHQPDTITCGLAGWFADKEMHTLDVETGFCNYTLLEHAALRDVAAGTTLHLRFYHFDLVAMEPAEAHVALLLGDEVAWETQVAIPSPANAFDVDFVAPRALSAGEPIRWHLHNHGQNSWVLTTLNVRTP